MLQEFASWSRRWASKFYAAGVLSSGYGPASTEEGVGQFLLTVLLGGFLGLIVGLIISQAARYIAFITGRQWGGSIWTVVGAVLGMIAFAMLAMSGNED